MSVCRMRGVRAAGSPITEQTTHGREKEGAVTIQDNCNSVLEEERQQKIINALPATFLLAVFLLVRASEAANFSSRKALLSVSALLSRAEPALLDGVTAFTSLTLAFCMFPVLGEAFRKKNKNPGNILISVLQMNLEPCIEIKKSQVGIFEKMMLLF